MSKRVRDYPGLDSQHPDAPWNGLDYVQCAGCGKYLSPPEDDSGRPPGLPALVNIEDAAEREGWKFLDLGDYPGNEGEPGYALGEDWFCPNCAEDRE